MNGNGQARTKPTNVAASVSELTHDVIELSELQARLVMLDVKESSQRARMCLALTIVAACVFLGTIPVALFTTAYIFVEQLGWSQAAGFAAATLIGLIWAAIFLGIAWSTYKKGLFSLDRSREELNRNIAWLKSTLRSRGTTNPTTNPPRQ